MPTILAVGVGGGLSSSLWETAGYRLKGSLKSNQPTKQPKSIFCRFIIFIYLFIYLLF